MAKDTCSYCKGTGKCPTCGGSGRIRKMSMEKIAETECRDCGRSGKCPRCQGKK